MREVGAEDLTTAQMAEVISREIGKPVEAVTVPTDKPGIREEFVRRFGTDDKFAYDVETHESINDGIVKFHTKRAPLPTKFADFIHQTWRPIYDKAVVDPASQQENYRSWLASLYA